MSGRVTFDLSDGTVIWGDREVLLTPQQAAILGVLAKRQPHWISVERLSAAIWPGGLPQQPESSCRVPIYRMRRKLAGMPIAIESRYGFGWRLVGEIDVT